MAEAVLFNMAEEIVTKLTSEVWKEIGLRWGVKDELEQLKETVCSILGVLLHMKELALESIQVKIWLGELKEAIYDADDLLDEFSTEALREQMRTGNRITKKVRLFFSSSNQFANGREIKAIIYRLHEIALDIKLFLEELSGEQTHSSAPEVVIGREKDRETITGPKGSREQTYSSAPEVVVGREQDKESVIELLLSSNVEENVSTLPIVGMGGLGKTTLAQLVYNNVKVEKNFELRIWVCVSDCFDVKLIVEKMIESTSCEKPRTSDMDALKYLLHEQISGRKFLIVLDDIWNEDPEKWFLLKDLLLGGARGSKIIITTRLRKAAELTRPPAIYELQGLSYDESWSLFEKMASKRVQMPRLRYESIGRKIVQRYLGVPLAIKTIGGFLSFKDSESEWLHFRDNQLSEVDQHDGGILPTLKLSYDHLPVHLKRCFAYFSLFPKGYRIDVELLIQLWIAQGCVKSSDPNECLEDIGVQYFADFHLGSFFQEVKKDDFGNYKTCKMHGLMHDVATVVAGEECASSSNFEMAISNTKTRHALFSSVYRVSPSLFKANKLRTLLLSGGGSHIKEHCDEVFSNLRCLRVLGLPRLKFETLPSSIDKLKHLRYLDLSGSDSLKTLPDSITNLQNLRGLKLNGCRQLSQLPKDMKELVNLTHLENGGCDALTHIPHGIGQLTSLEKLSVFVVAKDNSVSKLGAGLSELHGLNKLGGGLLIRNLGRVENGGIECKEANLKEKEHLQYLELRWGHPYHYKAGAREVENEKMALEALEPHQYLKGLSISGYTGVKLPSWFSSLINLVEIRLYSCCNIKCIPLSRQLPFLKKLTVEYLENLEYIDIDIGGDCDGGTSLFFPSLENLQLYSCPNLKGWNVEKPHLLQFPCLSHLKIHCPNLTSMPRCPSLKKLVYSGSTAKLFEQILKTTIVASESTSSSSSSSSSQLEHLSINGIKDLEFVLLSKLTSLQYLRMRGCWRITSLSCDDKDDEMQWRGLERLHYLELIDIPNLVCLPMGLQYVTSLRTLRIFRCSKLTSLPWDDLSWLEVADTSPFNFTTITSRGRQHATLRRRPVTLYSDNTALKEVIRNSKIPTKKDPLQSSTKYQGTTTYSSSRFRGDTRESTLTPYFSSSFRRVTSESTLPASRTTSYSSSRFHGGTTESSLPAMSSSASWTTSYSSSWFRGGTTESTLPAMSSPASRMTSYFSSWFRGGTTESTLHAMSSPASRTTSYFRSWFRGGTTESTLPASQITSYFSSQFHRGTRESTLPGSWSSRFRGGTTGSALRGSRMASYSSSPFRGGTTGSTLPGSRMTSYSSSRFSGGTTGATLPGSRMTSYSSLRFDGDTNSSLRFRGGITESTLPANWTTSYSSSQVRGGTTESTLTPYFSSSFLRGRSESILPTTTTRYNSWLLGDTAESTLTPYVRSSFDRGTSESTMPILKGTNTRWTSYSSSSLHGDTSESTLPIVEETKTEMHEEQEHKMYGSEIPNEGVMDSDIDMSSQREDDDQAQNSKDLEDMTKRVKEIVEEQKNLNFECENFIESEEITVTSIPHWSKAIKSSAETETEIVQIQEVDAEYLLFRENVGETVDSCGLQQLARQVVDMCSHNSRAIILMARALKGESDIDVWNNALETLRVQPASDEENSETLMVNVIKFYFGHLRDDATRKCIRNFALFCENQKIARGSLTDSWISDGLIVSYEEANEILETLVSAGLLESSEDGEVIELQETGRHILLRHIFPPIEGRFFLLQCSLGLTELPKDVEWEIFNEISLMDNKLSKLNENLICPKALALFLQRNFKLRMIHDSFFDQMPALEVLNLSRTRIKSLPESLFRLINLRRLFLNHCDLLLTLPPEVGELKCLEVLDIEGTEIISLPENVRKLSNLTCLKVSFCEPVSIRRSEQPEVIIPGGVLSALSKLEELSIDVSPEDERWNASVEDVVHEVCGLTSLETLKFYFPRVELLTSPQLDIIPMASPSLSHFSFTVGNQYAKRIISRLPRDVEIELDGYDKCLKYVNGDSVPEEIRKALKHASAFFLDRHQTVRKLSEFGITNMMQLKCCVVGECKDLQAIVDGDQTEEASGDTTVGLASLEYLYIYYAKNLSSLWIGKLLYNSSFKLLKYLTLYICPELSTVFTPGMLSNLSRLEELTLDDCPKITRLISCNDSEKEIKHRLPALKKIILHFLPQLVDICEFLQIAPSIEWMSFYRCPNLKTLTISKDFHKNLRKIKGEKHWWEEAKPRSTEQVSLDKIFIAVDARSFSSCK